MKTDRKLPRLERIYRDRVIAELKTQFNYKNPMQVPRPVKIVLNMGLGEAVDDVKIIDSAVEEMRAIAGQKPVVVKAKKSIANFKLREGIPIGVKVTLRATRMWEFLDRLISFALPRVRDFKGVGAKSFDGKGNYTLGLREQVMFPEVNVDNVTKTKGMNVCIVTTARSDEEARGLLARLGMPFQAQS